MRKVLLVSNKVFHYRIKIYNYFNSKFRDRGYELMLLANEVQKNAGIEPHLTTFELSFNFFKYVKKIKEIKPDAVIIFLHLSNLIMLPIILYLKFFRIPVIYWNHGVNLQDLDNHFKNFIYKVLHSLADRIILYSPNEIKYIAPKNQNKIYIANNTIVFDDELYPVKDEKENIKNELGIEAKFNILFVGRDSNYKKLDLIIEMVQEIANKEIGLLIVGPLKKNIDPQENKAEWKNIIYLGEIYDKSKLSKIYWISDLFCIPGANGLGLNEAMFWGLPCLTLNVGHSPEIWYLRNGENGFILNTPEELKEKIIELSRNRELLKYMGQRSREIILTEGHIDNMYNGFMSALESLKLND